MLVGIWGESRGEGSSHRGWRWAQVWIWAKTGVRAGEVRSGRWTLTSLVLGLLSACLLVGLFYEITWSVSLFFLTLWFLGCREPLTEEIRQWPQWSLRFSWSIYFHGCTLLGCVCVYEWVSMLRNEHLGSQGLSWAPCVSGLGARVVITELGQQGP